MAKRLPNAEIGKWLARIKGSSLSAPRFFARYRVPFSLAQFYVYRRRLEASGSDGLVDGRSQGNRRSVTHEAEAFLQGYVAANPSVGQQALRKVLEDRFGISLTQAGMSRCAQRLELHLEKPSAPSAPLVYAPHAGFELIMALACHLGWPQATAEAIGKGICKARRSGRLGSAVSGPARAGRNRAGRFTGAYNRRREVRASRFSPIAQKRQQRRLESMRTVSLQPRTLARRCLALLSLPFVTQNGAMRSVDGAMGMALEHLCGFRYKQSSLTHFLAELKYLGVSEGLLRHQVTFWQEHWRQQTPPRKSSALLCYYVDGNTKAVWSSKRVKKNKVAMLGRVMGCLEQVFVHDSYGRPVYFETHSGHGPVGEDILGLFTKIEDALEGPGAPVHVNRAIVMDGASNSVRTLRAFAAQDKYHYITSLDDNQWNPRKVRRIGRARRYRHGKATLRDCQVELEDSHEKGYLFVTRAIEVQWDYGKTTYLITSLPVEILGASEVVKAYFDRWPDQELVFKVMKSVASLNRVAGYGKQKMPDTSVLAQQQQLSRTIDDLRKKLREPMADIEELDTTIARLIPKERRLRAKSRIEKGERILSKTDAQTLSAMSREIDRHERKKKSIRKAHKEFRRLEKAQREWLRLQGKETVYAADVELDQIMTFFRVSLVNLYVCLAELLGVSGLSLTGLVAKVLLLPGQITETKTTKHVRLERNSGDPATMERLEQAIEKLNAMNIKTLADKRITFTLA
jgi:transposase